jgi:hypothetical protein
LLVKDMKTAKDQGWGLANRSVARAHGLMPRSFRNGIKHDSAVCREFW